MKKLILLIGICAVLAGCATKEPRVYCVPYSQWQALTPDEQREQVKWFKDHSFVAEQNLPYSVVLGDAQFGPPGSVPRKGPPSSVCFRNLYYEANINVDAYPFKAP
jgi:hypothetical protein